MRRGRPTAIARAGEHVLRVCRSAAELPGESLRIRVERAPDDLTVIAEERVTSHASTARVLEGVTIELTDDEVAWLYDALGRVREAILAEQTPPREISRRRRAT